MAEISELLLKAETGQLRMPVFQRGWVWSRKNVKELFDSLYHGYPIGSFIVWPSRGADGQPVEFVIDGRQRLSALYAVIKGCKPPWMSDRDQIESLELTFDLRTEEFGFVTKASSTDSLVLNVSDVFANARAFYVEYKDTIAKLDEYSVFPERVNSLKTIAERVVPVSRIPEHIDMERAAGVFEIVNRAGTRVNAGDLVLGKLSLEWPDAREAVEKKRSEWNENGFDVPLYWILRAMSVDLSSCMEYNSLIGATGGQVSDSFSQVVDAAEELQNLLRDQLGFDLSQKTSFNMGLIPIMFVRIRRSEPFGLEIDRQYLGWWLLGTLWGRWSADTKNRINTDLAILKDGHGVDGLIRELQQRAEGLQLRKDKFEVRSSPSQNALKLMRIMTRKYGARSLGNGLALSFEHVGATAGLQMHHIFPRKLLRSLNEPRKQIDQVANLAFITQHDNLKIGAKPPAQYLPELEDKNPGVLDSQWIPRDRRLWEKDRYRDFLEARRELLAEAANEFLSGMLGRDLESYASAARSSSR